MAREAELEKAEKRLERTELRDRQTMRPGLRSRQDTQNVKRTIRKLETDIESGKLDERELYDAIMNLHLLKYRLEGQKSAARFPVKAFEHVLLVHRLVNRFQCSRSSNG